MSATAVSFVSSVEAAFIAEVTDRDVNRVIDEHIVPDALIQMSAGRRISRLAAAFISFYFGTDSIFTAAMRKTILATIAAQVRASGNMKSALALDVKAAYAKDSSIFLFTTEVDASVISVDLKKYVDSAVVRANKVDAALEAISAHNEVMGGMPVFRGTRVPIDTVLASLEEGTAFSRLKSSYPFLTEDLVEAAKIYARVRPRRGRPRRLAELRPDWKVKSTKVVRAASK